MSRFNETPVGNGAAQRGSSVRRFALFIAASCLFSWWGYPIAWLTNSDGWANNFSLGPLIAAVLVISFSEGKAGLRDWWRRISRVRGPVRFYAVAIVLPAAIPLVSAGLAVLAGAEVPESSRWVENIVPSLALIIPAAIFFGPVGEEPAFRGLGQHQLQSTMSPLAAALIVGLGVTFWHGPMFATGGIPLTIAIALPAVSVVYAWLYRMSGTVWTPIALHTTMNTVSGMYLGEVFDGNAAELRLGFLAAFYVAWAGYIVYRYGTSLTGRGEQAPAGVSSATAPAQRAAEQVA